MSKIIIGIDPDQYKSGVATYMVGSDKVEVQSLTWIDLIEFIHALDKNNILIVVEAGWMNKAIWHGCEHKKSTIAASIGYDVGRNHQVGKCISDILKHMGYGVIDACPLKKVWSGRDKKITHEELASFVTINKNRTNQDERDAALLALVHGYFNFRKKII